MNSVAALVQEVSIFLTLFGKVTCFICSGSKQNGSHCSVPGLFRNSLWVVFFLLGFFSSSPTEKISVLKDSLGQEPMFSLCKIRKHNLGTLFFFS